jgi:hypothetical protein
MTKKTHVWTSYALIITTLAATACKLGGGGGGGGHHGGGGSGGGGLGGGGGAFSCTSGTTYKGDQVGGGDFFGWCIDHSSNAFSFADLTTSSATTSGGLTLNVSFNNFLNLTASADSGDAVEMPGTQLLVNPGTLLPGIGPSQNPVVSIVQQSGFCPSSGTSYRFSALPKSTWTGSKPAYGTVSLAASNATLTAFDLNGNPQGSETDPYTCDPSTSILTVTQSNGRVRNVTTSSQGLFVERAGDGVGGLPEATVSLQSTAAGGTFLGIIYKANAASPTQTVGFRPGGCAATLCGFDPTTSGQPSNGMTLNLGTESSFGLFTNGSLVDTNTDSPYVAIANLITTSAGSKLILYGITFDATANTPVAVLLHEQ